MLRDSGIEAKIPHSGELYVATRVAHAQNQANPDVEYLWRAACLVHGAMIAARGAWSEAYKVYHAKGFARGGEGEVTPLPPTSCIAFAAMMALGEAVARVRSQNQYAEEAASEAVRWFGMHNDTNYNAWHGTALLVIAYTRWKGGTGGNVSDLATYARGLLAPRAQPELCVLADHLAGNGDGQVQHSRFKKRAATFQAAECLYLFNAPL